MTDHRLIITGSREYDDADAITATLDRVLWSLSGKDAQGCLFLIHGEQERLGLPSYPEQIAAQWAAGRISEGCPVVEEVYPADWKGPCTLECTHLERVTFRGVSLCPQAGERANAQMVDVSPSTALACLRVGAVSSRARDCLSRLLRARVAFEAVVQGNARGLPHDLLGRDGR